MLAVSRPYALAAAALAAVSTVVITPVVARQVPLLVRQMETKLVDVGVENIPVNLFDDILNIPYSELEGGGIASVANSLMFTGTWWVPSTTNLWGIDPGDPTHIALIDNFLPFEAFTQGFTNADGVYEPGLNYEFAGVLAAELPNSASCDAASCAPMTPPDVITGSTQFDRDIGFLEAYMGNATDASGYSNGLFSQFFKVPISDLVKGYTFTPPPADTPTTGEPTTDPGVINPSGAVNSDWAHLLGWGSSGDPFEGGTTPVDLPGYGTVDVNPWYDQTFHLNLLAPFQTLLDSLEQAPSGGVDGTGIDALSLSGIDHTFENLFAGLIIDFDPYTAGSPACPALCDIPTSMQIPALVEDIAKMDPSNQVLSTWVTDYKIDPALVNEPTLEQINGSTALLQTGIYNLDATELTDVDKALAEINPELPQLLTNAGFYTDPTYLAYGNALTDSGLPGGVAPEVLNPSTGLLESTVTSTGELNTIYGGYDPQQVFNDLIIMLGDKTDLNALGDATLINFLADPLTGPDPFQGGAVDGGGKTLSELLAEYFPHAAAGASEPAASAAATLADSGGAFANMQGELATDWSTLMASFGATAGADGLSALMAEITAQLTADLSAFVPQSLLSMF